MPQSSCATAMGLLLRIASSRSRISVLISSYPIALPERVIGIGRNARSAWPESAAHRRTRRGRAVDVRRDTLRIAITLWKRARAPSLRPGRAPHRALRPLPKAASPRLGDHGGPWCGTLVLRKHTLHAEYLRVVGEWELRDLGDGEVSLRAVAHAPPKKESGYTGRGEDLRTSRGHHVHCLPCPRLLSTTSTRSHAVSECGALHQGSVTDSRKPPPFSG